VSGAIGTTAAGPIRLGPPAPAAAAALAAGIKREARRLGFALAGIARVERPASAGAYEAWADGGLAGEMGYMVARRAERVEPSRYAPWARAAVCLGMHYARAGASPAGEAARPAGRVARYARGQDYHDVLRPRLEGLVAFIRAEARRPVEARVCVDTSPVLERDLAARAGLGWIGKNTMLIHPRQGSWFFLAEILVDLDLPPDEPMADRCGRCARCLPACPTGAFLAPRVLDARRCIAYLTIELKGPIPRELRPLVGDWVFGCDLCQEACPYNVRPRPAVDPAFGPSRGLEAPDLIELLGLGPAEFRRRFAGSPIARAKRRGLLRNVAVALGNLRAAAAVPALARALEDGEPLVRGHAAWALGRIGGPAARAALAERLPREREAWVADELSAALSASAPAPPGARRPAEGWAR
jgi:epoxyqueuosine reductase